MFTSQIVTTPDPSTGRTARKRILLLAMLAMLVSGVASAGTRKPASRSADLYARNYVTIAADDSFRAHYQQWRRGFPAFDWGNDGCSGPAKATGYASNFFWPCVQHDFAYRNSRKAGRHNEATRKFADDQLLRHTKAVCSRYALLAKPGCYTAAGLFYTGVRNFGRSYF